MEVNFQQLEQQLNPRFAGGTLGSLISGQGSIIELLFFGAGILLLLYTISGGYKLLASRGDPKAVSQGKSTITNGIIGMVLVISAYWIVQAVGLVFGLSSNPNWPF